MHLHVQESQKVLCVCRDDRQVILVGVAPYGRIVCTAESDVWYRQRIASKGCHARYQRRRQMFIEKKSHARLMPPSRDRVSKACVDGLEVDSCEREWKRRPNQ